MGFFRLWFGCYLHPARAFEALRGKPAPLWGLYGILLRGLIIALLWMFPRALLRIEPSSVPWIPFLTTGTYYWHAMWLYPVFEFARWLLLCGLIHLILRLAGQPSSYDAILNVTGIGSLVIEPAVRVWDWIAFAGGWNGNLVFLGVSHAVLAWPWSLVLVAVGYRALMGIPPRWSVPVGFLASLAIIPLAAVFLRP